MDQLSLFDLGVKDTNIKQTSEKLDLSTREIIISESYLFFSYKWQYDDGHWHIIYASIALLDDYTVVLNDWYSYQFAYTFTNKEKALKYYIQRLTKIKEYLNYDSGVCKKINIHYEFEEMYHCHSNEYGCFRYWNDNYNPNYSVLNRYKDK